jgi:phenylalanyl-tRNA synthetase beta chain
MKIAYDHLTRFISGKPDIDELSEKLFQLGHEHEIENNIFDFEFTPNRGDCLSLNGLARDLAAFYPLNKKVDIYTKDIQNLELNFLNNATASCPKISFLNIEIENEVHEYCDYLEEYFATMGLKKINFFTDISNYLAYELGQPTHCYDFKTINNEIELKETDIDIPFDTLLNKKIQLKNSNLVFMMNEDVINLAGIIGGDSTSCSESTTNVLIECAFFKPESIIGKSIKYNINSDAAHKFERGVDPTSHEFVLRRFLKIVEDHASVRTLAIKQFSSKEIQPSAIKNDFQKVRKIIGMDISILEYEDILRKLGFFIVGEEIIIPAHRHDIYHHNDIAEEVARVIGYDNITSKAFSIKNRSRLKAANIEDHIRSFFTDNGFYEVINFPFTDLKKDNLIKVDNPLDSNKPFLRHKISNSLITNVIYNEKRQKESLKLFEISDIYTKKDNKIIKSRMLGAVVSGRLGNNHLDFSKKLDSKYLSGILEGVIPNSLITINEFPRELLDSKIKTPIFYIEIKISDFLEAYFFDYKLKNPNIKSINKYKPISEFPSSYRDISILIHDSAVIPKLKNDLLSLNADNLKESFVFDFYHNHKKMNYKIGFRFIFQSHHKTLTDKDVDREMKSVINLISRFKEVEIPGMIFK